MANGVMMEDRMASLPAFAIETSLDHRLVDDSGGQDASREAFEVWWSKAPQPQEVRPYARIAWLAWQAAWLFRTVELRDSREAALAAFEPPSTRVVELSADDRQDPSFQDLPG